MEGSEGFDGMLVAYVVIGLALLALGIVLYLRSVESRRTYTCGACGETQKVELMAATRCSVCGAPIAPKGD